MAFYDYYQELPCLLAVIYNMVNLFSLLYELLYVVSTMLSLVRCMIQNTLT